MRFYAPILMNNKNIEPVCNGAIFSAFRANPLYSMRSLYPMKNPVQIHKWVTERTSKAMNFMQLERTLKVINLLTEME
jgi:hypothetical protein